MASVSSLHLFFSTRSTPSSFHQGPLKRSRQSIRCCRDQDSDRTPSLQATLGFHLRRDVMLHAFLTYLSIPAMLPFSDALAAEQLKIYTDEVNKFEISIPNDWQVGAGEPNGFKSITAFYPEETSASNVSVVITGLGADFTRLESLGKVDEFAETLVSGLDRSWQRPPGVTAKLIDCKSSNGFYYIEYSLKSPGESAKHIYSAIGMASNGWYNRLYTVTGQFLEEESEKFCSDIQKVVTSFKFI